MPADLQADEFAKHCANHTGKSVRHIPVTYLTYAVHAYIEALSVTARSVQDFGRVSIVERLALCQAVQLTLVATWKRRWVKLGDGVY